MHRSKASACALPALVLATIAANPAAAKTPGSQYCFLGVCHRVLTLAETKAQIGKPRAMHASHYDSPERDRFNPSLLTSSGEIFRPDAPDNAASPIYPDGTQIAVFAPATKRGAIVRINNAGPYFGNRTLDLSRATAERLGFAHAGVGRVIVEVLAEPKPAEARYVKHRRYPAVAGYIGKAASIEDVRTAWEVRNLPRVVIAAKSEPTPARPPLKLPPIAVLPALRTATAAPPDRLASTKLASIDLILPQPAFDLAQAPPLSIPALATLVSPAQYRRAPVLAARESQAPTLRASYPKVASAAPLETRRGTALGATKAGMLR